MVNIAITGPTTGTSVPSSSNQPDTTVGVSHNTTQFKYASPAGTINNVVTGVPAFVGNSRLAVTLAAGNSTWNSMSPGADGQHMTLWNTDPANTLTLNVNNANGFVGGTFQGSAGSYALIPGNPILMQYYAGTVKAWVIIP